ncbi:tRNA pseudouridine(13) synthase TruD [Candidatus Pacearchaeota archaeon]|nr:MAG: tRNA pseudouridine(13) synthase TruD [Candidatus Pacearchaeota archaeon]
MFKLKQIPEDFVVEECLDLKLRKRGRYGYYLLKKRGITTTRAVSIIARKFRVKEKYINYSGLKDKCAVTSQYISISRGPARSLSERSFTLTYLGRGNARINLSSHSANRFEIVVRNLLSRPRELPQYVNYFDEQRFGESKLNHVIGRAILKRDFKSACEMIPETREHLSNFPRDYVGALSRLPGKLVRLFCHAYQSYLWNEQVSLALSKFQHKEIFLPLNPPQRLVVPLEDVGSLKGKRKMLVGASYLPTEIAQREGLTREMMNVKQFRGLVLSSKMREIFMDVRKLRIGKLERDELNEGKFKVRVEFVLPSGSYATMLVKQLFIDEKQEKSPVSAER